MWRLKFELSCAVVLGLAMCGSVDGEHYVVALLGHNVMAAADIEYLFVVTNTHTGQIVVKAIAVGDRELETKTIASNASEKFTPLNRVYALNSSEVANKSIIVQSNPESATFTLQVFVTRKDVNYVEGFMGIPIETLMGPVPTSGFYEYIVTTFCAVGGYCQFAIASYNETAGVYVKFPARSEKIVFCIGKRYHRSERDTELTLKPYDAVQFETTSDLTGTHIYSNKPIVVFAGSYNVTYNGTVAHTVEQLPASSNWGKNYAVRTLSTNGYGDIVKISSNWANTVVKMKGYPPLKLGKQNHTVTRRSGKDMVNFITASHPIQVVLITGLGYATEEANKLGMTVVPATEHALTSAWVSCDGSIGDFHLVTEKLKNASVTVDSVPLTATAGIEYTDYIVGTVLIPSTDATNVAGDSVNGIITCNSTAVMPLSTRYITQTAANTVSTKGMCKETQTAKVEYNVDVPNRRLKPHMVSIETDDDILTLRVLNCGQTVVQFYQKGNTATDSMVIHLSRNKIIVTDCFPKCDQSTTYTDTYNFVETTVNCMTDMVFYWFRQFEANGVTKFCMGVGPFPDRSPACTEGTLVIPKTISNRFIRVSMMGLHITAHFNYDFLPISGCSSYNHGTWRCADNIGTCAKYGKSICSDTKYNGFVEANCRKYCKKCKVDALGNIFRVLMPTISFGTKPCSFYVTSSGTQTAGNVAVGSKDKVLKAEVHKTTRSYSCDFSMSTSNVYVIVADTSVAVSVVYGEDNTIWTYTVYPLDSYSSETMVITKEGTSQCSLLSDYGDIQVTPYYTSQTNPPSIDTQPFTVTSTTAVSKQTISGKGLEGTLFRGDGLFTVFCGVKVRAAPFNYYNQMVPSESWSTQYKIPAFSSSTVNRPFDAKLTMLATADNTIISIDGDFTATHVIYFRGRRQDQQISATSVYSITSNYPIAVAIELYDPANVVKSAFHLVPPVGGFMNQYKLSIIKNKLENVHSFVVENDITTYFVSSQGQSNNGTASCDENECSLVKSADEEMLGISVIIGKDNEWFVLPAQTGAVPHEEPSICVTTDMVVGDNVDNDCDNLNNVDVCPSGYGVYVDDFNLDGFGTDCCCEETENPIVQKPDEPVCLEINQTDGYCRTVCNCKCSWVKKLEDFKKMSPEEKKAAADKDIEHYKNALHIETTNLTSATSLKISKMDSRKSSANIGYVGIALFTLVIGTIVILDVTAVIRDGQTAIANIGEGCARLRRLLGC